MLETIEVRRIVPTDKQYAWTFGGAAPLARIKPGDVLDLYTEDCFGGKVRSEKDLFTKVCEYPFVNPQTGPFYVDGAEPGDTLAIHLIDVQPARDWAASVTVPLFGALTGTHYTQTLQDPLPEKTWIYKVDQASKTVRFQALDSDYGTSFPLEPFHGTIGVAPAAFEARNVLVPEAFGGNMDTPEAKAGATIYLGVNMAGGSYRPLEDAFRIAHTQIVQWVSKDTGLSMMDTYQLVSQAARSRIANVCDANYTVVAKVPKQFLPKDIPWMDGVHQKMRARSKAVLASRQSR